MLCFPEHLMSHIDESTWADRCAALRCGEPLRSRPSRLPPSPPAAGAAATRAQITTPPQFEPLERPQQVSEPLERPGGPNPRSRFLALRLALAAALRCRSPDDLVVADTGIRRASDIGQWTSLDVFLAPTCSRKSAWNFFFSSSVFILSTCWPHEEPLMCSAW